MHFATMANWIQLSLFIYFGFWSAVNGAQLTINFQTDTMTVTCRPGIIVSKVLGYTVMTLERNVRNSPSFTKIVTAAPLKNNGQASLTDQSLMQRATVTGKADNNDKPGSFVQIVLRQLSCSDSGEYLCKISYLNQSLDSVFSNDNKNATIRSDPGPVDMFVSPRKEASPYFVNDTVEFRCTGDIGNPPQRKPWSWQWKYAGGSMMDMWKSYPYTDRIKDDTVTPENCANKGGSTLTHIVSVDDNARMFRCLVNNNEMYSDNFTIYTETVTTPRPGGVAGGDTSSADIGLIVGIVLGVLAVIAIVIVLVYFLWYRRRNSGEQYKTEEDKHPESNARPDHLTPNPVYDTRPEPKDFRKKKGEVNPAMDDRHNSSRESLPSYDSRPQHNDRGYNYSYEEDGGAMPIGSAV